MNMPDSDTLEYMKRLFEDSNNKENLGNRGLVKDILSTPVKNFVREGNCSPSIYCMQSLSLFLFIFNRLYGLIKLPVSLNPKMLPKQVMEEMKLERSTHFVICELFLNQYHVEHEKKHLL